MDWTSATLGAFFAIALVFGVTMSALYAILREKFLLWMLARVYALAVMVWALSPLLPNFGFLDASDRLLIGAMATDLSLAVCGPMLAAYIEPRIAARKTRTRLRKMLPAGLIPIALLPTVIYSEKLDWLHDLALLGLAGLLIWGLVTGIAIGSRVARFQAVAWTPALVIGLAALVHELLIGGTMPYYLSAMLVAIIIEIVVTSMGVADSFMRVREERDRALEGMREAKLATALDPLTNIANRRGLEQQFAGKHRQRPQGLALVDCDHFKRINDQFGHDVGDRVLCAVARGLDGDQIFVARLGGEEFVLLLYGRNWQESAENARRRITQAVRDAIPELPYPITASAGLAALEDKDTLGSVMKRADRALYAAKEGGRNRSLSLTEFRPAGSLRLA